MLLFLEWRSLIEIFSQLRLQWRKNLTQNYQTLPLPQRRINFVRFVNLLFFMCDSFSEEGCHVVTSKSNSEETVCSCNHLTHFAVLMDYDGSKKVTKLFLPYSIILWAQWTNLILSLNFFFLTQLTEEDETILKIITYVGLSLSIVGILLTLILYYCLTYVMYLNIDDVDSHLPSTRLERKEISMQISMPIRKYMSAE